MPKTVHVSSIVLNFVKFSLVRQVVYQYKIDLNFEGSGLAKSVSIDGYTITYVRR